MPYKFNPFTGNLDFYTGGAGSGDVVGPASSDDKAIARYDGTTGKLIQNSPGTKVQDSGAVESQGFITNRIVTGTVDVADNQSWIAPSLEVQPGAIIRLGAGAQLIII